MHTKLSSVPDVVYSRQCSLPNFPSLNNLRSRFQVRITFAFLLQTSDTTKEAFSAFLTFLYSAHSPIEDSDSCGILELANLYGVPRLVTLCELYITKEVERATAADIKKSEISVVDLLLMSQDCNAQQLEKFCLHFISCMSLLFCTN